jgi:hypothetical protein
MNRTIEAKIDKLAEARPNMMPANAKRLTANWQNGLESGGLVQRKLRLGFASAAAQQPEGA